MRVIRIDSRSGGFRSTLHDNSDCREEQYVEVRVQSTAARLSSFHVEEPNARK